MLLFQVLQILHNHIADIGYTTRDSFLLVFKDVFGEDVCFNNDENVKKYFSGARPFNQYMTKTLANSGNFEKLLQSVKSKYLSIAGNRNAIYEELSELLVSDNFMRTDDKEKILAACDYTQASELARFISACIVCGNYNTIQKKSKKAKINEEYDLCIDFMYFEFSVEQYEMRKKLWISSQRAYIESYQEGKRFHALNIIERLLPHGYVSSGLFTTNGKTEDGDTLPLIDLCMQRDSDIAIVGDGGIGKTTFLQHLMSDEYLTKDNTPRQYSTGKPMPFFIELNRCPDHIGRWYSDSLRKTNFITRYIGQMVENHSSVDTVSADTLDAIEKEFQRVPSNGKAQYILLLDGFNEVRTNHSVRTHLSNEISILHKYPNIRIITTSRETQTAYYASEFENIRLVGLDRNDIVLHLRSCGVPEPLIGNAVNCESLYKCLQIPLYLCMFSYESQTTNFLPETAGEILYCFFHKDSAFYNVRTRMAETRTGILNKEQLALVLDFLLPYIGWKFEKNDVFSMNENDFRSTIKEGMGFIANIFCNVQTNPFPDFKYSGTYLKSILALLGDENALFVDDIITCIYDYLGIVYQYSVGSGDFVDRVRYAFCHHHFRDYFSAMWDVQILALMQCVPVSTNENVILEIPKLWAFVDEQYWPTQKVQFISEVLMEHRNKPIFDEKSQNWITPKTKYDEQSVLKNAISFCRSLHRNHMYTKYFLPNVLSAILYGRNEYSGLDLSYLNLKHCHFFNVICSRIGKTKTLAADFSHSVLSEENFIPENHRNNVMEYVYSGTRCYTIDDSGIIKCWDIYSGKQEYELISGDPLGPSDFSVKGYIKISKDGRYLAAKVQDSDLEGLKVYLNVFDLLNPDAPPIKIKPNDDHTILSFFGFTEDSRSILLLCDRKIVYCMDVCSGEQHYVMRFDLLKQSELFADDSESNIYAYTAEYDTYETDAEATVWNNNDIDEEEDDFNNIPCALCVLDIKSRKDNCLYNFIGAPGTAPTTVFIPDKKCFIIYNHENGHIEYVDCLSMESYSIVEELTDGGDRIPSAIHLHPECLDELYIMYPDVCFDVEIKPNGNCNIIMTYPISGAEKLLRDSEQNGDLEFKTNVIPMKNRFVVANDTNTYEWDTDNDSLYLRYNCSYYECIAFFVNSDKNKAILVHRDNGVTVFEGQPVKLKYQYCFQEPDYHVGSSCYNDRNDLLAISFEKPEHEKVTILDLKTGKQKDVFSSLHPGETVKNLCFDNEGFYILITTQYRCLECIIDSGVANLVATAGDNERLAAGKYVCNEIEIAVVEHSCDLEPHIDPYCVFYNRSIIDKTVSYYRVWQYLMPELTKEQFSLFICHSNDFGVAGSYDADGMQKYWVTEGFFLENCSEIKDIFHPKCYKWQGNRKLAMCHEMHQLDMIFVYHKSAIVNQYNYEKNSTGYMYLSDDMREAILYDGRHKLHYCTDLRTLTYQGLNSAFAAIGAKVDNYAYWDFAVPWFDGKLLGCYEFYNLIALDSQSNELIDKISYNPGVSISKCIFNNSKIDLCVKEIISTNS